MTSMTRKGFEETTMEKNNGTVRSSSSVSSAAALATSTSQHQKQPFSLLKTTNLPLRRRVILSWCMVLMVAVYNLWGSLLKTATGNAVWIYSVATTTAPTTTIVGGSSNKSTNHLDEATKNEKSIAAVEERVSPTQPPVSDESTMMFNVNIAALKERIKLAAAERSSSSNNDSGSVNPGSVYAPIDEIDVRRYTESYLAQRAAAHATPKFDVIKPGPIRNLPSGQAYTDWWNFTTNDIIVPDQYRFFGKDRPTSLEILSHVMASTPDVGSQEHFGPGRGNHSTEPLPSCYIPNVQRTRDLANDIANGTIGDLPFPILNVGMPKMGSSTLKEFFLCHGVSTTHHQQGLHMLKSVRNGDPPLSMWTEKSKFGRNKNRGPPLAHMQLDRTLAHGGYPQIQLLDELHQEVPNSTFILLFRPVDDWYISAQHQAGMPTRWGKMVMPGIRLTEQQLVQKKEQDDKKHNFNLSKEQVRNWWCTHVEHIREYVRQYPSHRLIELDLNDKTETPYLLDKLFNAHQGTDNALPTNPLDYTSPCWGHYNNRVNKKQSMHPPRTAADKQKQAVISDNNGSEDDTIAMDEEEDDSNKSGNEQNDIIVEPMKLAAGDATNTTNHNNTPFLCIHVGPSKTGTTTIQKNSANFTSLLAKDNAIYAGKFANTGWAKLFYYFRKCLNKAYKATVEISRNSTSISAWKAASGECWEKHMQQQTKYDGVEHNKSSKESIILSDEGYSYPRGPMGPRTSRHIQEFFEVQNGYNITVIATYRWYDEWLLSTLKEENKHAQYTVGNKKHKGTLWPQLGGRKWEDPWKYVQKHVASDNFNARFYNNVDQTVPRWRKSGFQVKIMDFQSPIDIMEDFYCNQIGQDKVPHTCAYTQSLGKDMPVHHVGSLAATAYDKILVEAVDLGLVDLNNITRYQARQDLMDYHTGILGLSFLDLPLICPNELSLNQVLQKALAFDDKVQQLANFPYPDKRQEEHKASFDQLKLSKVFCFVNEQVLLSNATTWEEVLGRLNNTWAERIEVIGGVAKES